MTAHSSPMTDILIQSETLTENSESAASEPPEKRIPLSPDTEIQEHDKAILHKEVSDRNGLLSFPGFVGYIIVTFVVKLVRATPIIDML